MSKQVVILYNDLEAMVDPLIVTLFDEIHDPIPYVKKLLQNWDIYNEEFLRDLSKITTITEAQELIDRYNIFQMQIHVIKEINPKG